MQYMIYLGSAAAILLLITLFFPYSKASDILFPILLLDLLAILVIGLIVAIRNYSWEEIWNFACIGYKYTMIGFFGLFLFNLMIPEHWTRITKVGGAVVNVENWDEAERRRKALFEGLLETLLGVFSKKVKIRHIIIILVQMFLYLFLIASLILLTTGSYYGWKIIW